MQIVKMERDKFALNDPKMSALRNAVGHGHRSLNYGIQEYRITDDTRQRCSSALSGGCTIRQARSPLTAVGNYEHCC